MVHGKKYDYLTVVIIPFPKSNPKFVEKLIAQFVNKIFT